MAAPCWRLTFLEKGAATEGSPYSVSFVLIRNSSLNRIEPANMETLSTRSGFVLYTLSAAVVLTAGSTLVRQGWLVAALACWGLLVPMVLAAFFDRIQFDG